MNGLVVLMAATLLIIVLPATAMMVYYRVSQGEWLWQDRDKPTETHGHDCTYCSYRGYDQGGQN